MNADRLKELGSHLEAAGVLLEAAKRLIDVHFASKDASGDSLNRRLENLRGALCDLTEDLATATTPLAREIAEAQRPRPEGKAP